MPPHASVTAASAHPSHACNRPLTWPRLGELLAILRGGTHYLTQTLTLLAIQVSPPGLPGREPGRLRRQAAWCSETVQREARLGMGC